MAGSLHGKVAVVTGASANLGKLFAEALAADGAKIVIHYNSASKQTEAEKLAQLRSCTSFNKGLPKKEKSERKGVIKI